MWTKFFIFFVLNAVCADSTIYYGQAGQDVKMKCGEKENVATVSWTYNSNFIISIEIKSGKTRKGNADIANKAKLSGTSLQINSLNSEDSGTFECTATDRSKAIATTTHRLHVVNVAVSVKPPSPLPLSTEAQLTCDIGEGSQAEVGWNHLNRNFTGKTILLKDVKLSDGGTWTCQIKDENGKFHTMASLVIAVKGSTLPKKVTVQQRTDPVPPGTPAVVRTTGVPRPRPWQRLNKWIWVTVGAGSLVMIMLVVAVVLACQSNKRKKMRMRKLRSVRKPLTDNDYCQCNRQYRRENMDRPVRVPRQQRVSENIEMNGGYGGRKAHM